jgi:hypothetical protein
MVNAFVGPLGRFVVSSAEFERKLRAVRSEQWAWPTPCTDWTVRHLGNHMARGDLNYVRLLQGGTGAEFLHLRDADALGTDPVGAAVTSRYCVFQAMGAKVGEKVRNGRFRARREVRRSMS